MADRGLPGQTEFCAGHDRILTKINEVIPAYLLFFPFQIF